MPTPETVGTGVNGILGASCELWDEDEEDEDGPPNRSRRGAGTVGDHSESAHGTCSGTRVVRWETDYRCFSGGVYVNKDVFYVGAGDHYITLGTLDASSVGQDSETTNARMVTYGGCAL